MSTQQILGAVGAVVGAYFGNPQLGYAIGSAIGGAIDPEIIKGPTIGDIAKQTSMEGVPRPIIWALSPPMGGNIIASSDPKIVRKRKSQGKGGPKVESEHVYRTYAIGVCEGPITRFVRIWRNNTLVFDVSEFSSLTDQDNINFLTHGRFMLGGWTQNAHPALEREFGVGTTPAHRGTAYLVMDDEELTDLRGAIPQWMFQVERCEGFFLTSRPYPVESLDALDSWGAVPRDGPSTSMEEEALASIGSIIGGTFVAPLEIYDDGLPEALTSEGTLISGIFDDVLIIYDDGLPEALDSDGSIISGVLDDALIVYDEYPPEALDSSGTIESGSLI